MTALEIHVTLIKSKGGRCYRSELYIVSGAELIVCFSWHAVESKRFVKVRAELIFGSR